MSDSLLGSGFDGCFGLEETQGLCRTGGNTGRLARFRIAAEVAFISDNTDGAALGIAVVNAGHGDGIKGAGAGAFAAAPAGIFVNDDLIVTEGDAVKGTGVEAARFWTLLALDGFGDF